MTVDSATLDRLRVLEQLYTQGYHDEVIDLTVRKLVEHQLRKDEAHLAALRADLDGFEARYGMTSEDFFIGYQAGEMGDDSDAIEWVSLYKMHLRLAEATEALKGQLG